MTVHRIETEFAGRRLIIAGNVAGEHRAISGGRFDPGREFARRNHALGCDEPARVVAAGEQLATARVEDRDDHGELRARLRELALGVAGQRGE